MLGKHFLGMEYVVGLQLALCNHAFSFLEKIGKDALVDYRHGFGRIGDIEVHRQSIGLALQTANFNQTADTEVAALRRFLVVYLGRREIQADVVFQCVQHETYCQCHQSDTCHIFPLGMATTLAPWALAVGGMAFLAKVVVLAVVVAVVESTNAKLRLFRVPELLMVAFILSLLALVLYFIIGA